MISTSPTAWDYFGENDNRIILSYNINKQAKTLFSFKQMILRTLKKYINGTVLLHVGKRYRIITADWIVLWGWALGSWWIPIRWLYLKTKQNKTKKHPSNLKEADGTNLYFMKCPLFHIHHFFSLDWTEHAFFNLII